MRNWGEGWKGGWGDVWIDGLMDLGARAEFTRAFMASVAQQCGIMGVWDWVPVLPLSFLGGPAAIMTGRIDLRRWKRGRQWWSSELHS